MNWSRPSQYKADLLGGIIKGKLSRNMVTPCFHDLILLCFYRLLTDYFPLSPYYQVSATTRMGSVKSAGVSLLLLSFLLYIADSYPNIDSSDSKKMSINYTNATVMFLHLLLTQTSVLGLKIDFTDGLNQKKVVHKPKIYCKRKIASSLCIQFYSERSELKYDGITNLPWFTSFDSAFYTTSSSGL